MGIHYSEVEREKIVENLKKIKEYCDNEIRPKLKVHESVVVEFGDNYGFGVSHDGGVWFRTGGLTLKLSGMRPGEDSAYDSFTFCVALLDQWRVVKYLLKERIKAMDSTRKMIMNFEV